MITAASAPARGRQRRRGRFRITVRGLRLASGLVLFAYVLAHLVDHALGNVSLAAMEAALGWIRWFWRLPGVGWLLYGAVAIHLLLAFHAIYARPSLEWRPAEFGQLLLGFALVPLIAGHVLSTRLAYELYGTQQGYAQLLYLFWVASPLDGLRQIAALLVAWLHACLGLNFYLRLKPVYPRLAPVLLGLAVLVPALSVLGFVHAGREVAVLAQDADWRIENLPAEAQVEPGEMSAADRMAAYYRWIVFGQIGGIGLVLLARFARGALTRRGGTVRLTYPGGAVVVVPKGTRVLEASRLAGIPHASVCGGRGRCSTCRIRLPDVDPARLASPSAAERVILDRIGAGPDMRLACQFAADQHLTVVPLLSPQTDAAQVRRGPTGTFGEEHFLVAMFVDMRGSTRLAERRLPFDTVFIINRFLEVVADGVVEAGGSPNQFLGDGLMALFGMTNSREEAARQAIEAVRLVGRNVRALNVQLARSTDEPIRFGIGLHAGSAILGEIGDRVRNRTVLTAVGDPVNVAARLQVATKRLGCEALISEAVFEAAGLVCTLPVDEVELEGRAAEVRAHAVTWAREPVPVEVSAMPAPGSLTAAPSDNQPSGPSGPPATNTTTGADA